MNLSTLDTATLLRHAYAELDDLTSSDLERELLRRLEATDTDAFEAATELGFTGDDLRKLGEAMEGFTTEEVTDLLGVMLEMDIDAKPVIEMLRLLDKAGITEPDELQVQIDLAKKFQDVANDMAEVLPRLTALINETQE